MFSNHRNIEMNFFKFIVKYLILIIMASQITASNGGEKKSQNSIKIDIIKGDLVSIMNENEEGYKTEKIIKDICRKLSINAPYHKVSNLGAFYGDLVVGLKGENLIYIGSEKIFLSPLKFEVVFIKNNELIKPSIDGGLINEEIDFVLIFTKKSIYILGFKFNQYGYYERFPSY